MAYVVEIIFRPFMNLFESIGVPGQVFPMLFVVVAWGIKVPRNIIKKQVTWRDWMLSIFLIMIIPLGIIDMR